ncbi:MAG: tetratricopeptide repeat protein [Pseudonocardiaceae bacterium]
MAKSQLGVELVDTICGILGATALRIDGRLTTDWGTPKLRKVVAALLTQPNRPMSIDRLTEWVWPENTAPQDRTATLHSYAWRIRQALDRADQPITLDTTVEGYQLTVNPATIDYHLFCDLRGRARQLRRSGQPHEAAELVSRAIALWRGEPLAGMRTERAENWRTRVLDEWISANVDLVTLWLEADRTTDALGRLDELRAEHPWVLSLIELHIETLYRLGRGRDASTAYLAARRQFRDDADEHAAAQLRECHDRLRSTGIAAPADQHRPGLHADVALAPWQLPHDVADFIGRGHLLDSLAEAVTGESGQVLARVVAVHGPAGVGKTTTVIHWAHTRRELFPDGALFIELDGYSDREPVGQATVVDLFLEALGHVPDPATTTRARATRLNSLLGDRRVLVVLDNARGSEHVRDLLPVFSRCLVIVTSRQRLSQLIVQHGAHEVQVDPMPEDEAVSLLTARHSATALMTREALSGLVQVCAGLPLVLNIAAEQVATHPSLAMREVTRLLNDPRELLDIGGQEGSATVRTMLDHSYRALPVGEQRLFRLLAVQPGAEVDVRAASAIDGRPPDVTRRSLDALANTHLIARPDAADRYKVHDLLRAYSAHHLAHGPPTERHAAERRLLSFWLQSTTNALREVIPDCPTASSPPPEPGVVPLTFPDGSTAAKWVLTERITIGAIIRTAAELGHHDFAWRIPDAVAPVFDLRGYYQDSRDVLRIAVTSTRHCKEADDRDEAGALCDLGLVHLNLGDYRAARRCLDRALNLLTEDKLREQAAIRHTIARLEILEERLEEGVAQYQQVLELARSARDNTLLCWTHCRLGRALLHMSRYDQALLHLRQAQMLSEDVGDDAARAQALIVMGAVHRELGEFRIAEAYCQQALTQVGRTQDLPSTVLAYMGLAELHSSREDYPAARIYAQRAVEFADHIRSTEPLAHALDMLAECECALGDLDAAKQDWGQAAELLDDLGQPRGAQRVRTRLAQLPSSSWDLPSARTAAPDGSANRQSQRTD